VLIKIYFNLYMHYDGNFTCFTFSWLDIISLTKCIALLFLKQSIFVLKIVKYIFIEFWKMNIIWFILTYKTLGSFNLFSKLSKLKSHLKNYLKDELI